MAEWLGMGLQSPVTGFDSRRRLHCLLGYHEVWHVFTVVAVALQFAGVGVLIARVG